MRNKNKETPLLQEQGACQKVCKAIGDQLIDKGTQKQGEKKSVLFCTCVCCGGTWGDYTRIFFMGDTQDAMSQFRRSVQEVMKQPGKINRPKWLRCYSSETSKGTQQTGSQAAKSVMKW